MQIPTSGPRVGPDPSALLRSPHVSTSPRSTMRSKPLVNMRNTRSPHCTTHLALIQDGACWQPLSPSKNPVQKPPPQAQEQGYGATVRNSSGAHNFPGKSVLFPLVPSFLPSDESTVLYSSQTQPAHCPLAHQPGCSKVTDTGTARRTGRGWRSDVAPENHVLPPLCEVSTSPAASAHVLPGGWHGGQWCRGPGKETPASVHPLGREGAGRRAS